MNFLKKILNPAKTDQFGIDGAIDGIRQLKQRLGEEKQQLQVEKEKARDAALGGLEFDETAIIKQERRIAVFEDALEKAVSEASSQIQGQMPEIQSEISNLEVKQTALSRKRDEEMLRAVAAFIKATGARIADYPRVGHGGVLNVISTNVMTLDEVKAFMNSVSTDEPVQSKTQQAIDVLLADLQRLKAIRHLGARNGIEALVG